MIYSIILLGLINIVNILDMMIISIFMPVLKQTFHLTDSQAGLLAGCSRIAGAVAGIPLARVADTWIRKRLLLLSLVAWSCLTMLCGAAGSFLQILIMRIGVGSAEAAAPPTSHSLVADLVAPGKRAGAFAVLTLGGTLGNGLGLVLGGAAIDFVGWRWTFVLMGLPGLLLAVLVALTFREPPRGRYDDPLAGVSAASTWGTFRALLGRRSYVHVLIGATLISFSIAVTVWLPSAFVRTFHRSLAEVGSLYGSTAMLASIAGLSVGGYFGNRSMSRDVRWGAWLPIIALSFYAPLTIAMLFAPSFGLALIAAGFFFMIPSIVNAPVFAVIQAVARGSERATAIALVLLLVGIIGAGGGPLLVGAVSDLLARGGAVNPLRAALIITSLLPLWGAVHLALASRTLREDSRFTSSVSLNDVTSLAQSQSA